MLLEVVVVSPFPFVTAPCGIGKAVKLTEAEFVAMMKLGCAGTAGGVMQQYSGDHAAGLMSIRDIYANLCDIFLWHIRPPAALEKLHHLNKNNHGFRNIAVAAMYLCRWALLASLDTQNEATQEILMSECCPVSEHRLDSLTHCLVVGLLIKAIQTL